MPLWFKTVRKAVRGASLAPILRGAGASLDLMPDLRPPAVTPESADLMALRSDWHAVGQDILEAMPKRDGARGNGTGRGPRRRHCTLGA